MSEPAHDPAAPGNDPAPTPTELEQFIDRLSGFDPGAIIERIDSLGKQLVPADIAASVQAALAEPLADLTKAVNDLRKLARQGVPAPPTPGADPQPDPAAGGVPPQGSPPVDPSPGGSPQPSSGGVAETLFGIPRV